MTPPRHDTEDHDPTAEVLTAILARLLGLRGAWVWRMIGRGLRERARVLD